MVRSKKKRLLAGITCVLTCYTVGSYNHCLAQSSVNIRESIRKSIETSISNKGYNLDIESKQGTVWLRGTVSSEQDRDRIVRIAKETAGVTAVKTNLVVQPISSPDTPELARQVQARLQPLTSNSNHAVTITARGRTITLSGFVSSETLKDKLLRAAQETSGVERVVTQIIVSRPPDLSIEQRVRESIAQNSDIKIKGLAVEVRDGAVILRGTAQSRDAIQLALTAALMTDGVESVRSELRAHSVAASSQLH